MALDYFKRLNLPGTGAKRAELASREAARMGRLLEEILLYAKPIQLEIRRLDLGQLLGQVLSTHRAETEARGQRFEILGEGGEWMLGDRDRLTQVILNLTQNASEAAPEASTIRWKLETDRRAGTLGLEVSNPGPPVPQDLLPRLTQPFFTTKPAGTGLGLSIVKRLVEAHGGDVEIDSDAQSGTRVRLLFALAEAEAGVEASCPKDRGTV
jgi:signal transduction histidine kinase